MPSSPRILHQLLALGAFCLVFLYSAHVPAWDKIDEQLARKISFDFVDTPLAEAIYKIVGDVDLNVFIDGQSLAEEGIAIDEPIDRKYENISAKEAITGMLLPLGLTWEKTDETEIRVTTIVDTERDVVRLYDVSDLLASDQTSATGFLSTLLKASQENYREKDGGGGTVLLRNGLLVIWHHQEAHQKIADYLKALRKVKNLKPVEIDSTPIYKSLLVDEKSHAAFLALQTPISMDYELAPIETHLAKIAKQVKLEYQVDDTDVERAKEISTTLKRNSHPFRSLKQPALTAIGHLLIGYQLDFTLRAGKLIITNRKEGNHPYLTLCFKIDEASGWDAESIADIVQDAVDRGEWQAIDGQGGTIAQPLNDVLLIQNTAPALYQAIKVLDQLKQRPKSEMAEGPKPESSAGIGRRAPNNDWHRLAENDRIVVRLQADQLPEVDEVVCYKRKRPR